MTRLNLALLLLLVASALYLVNVQYESRRVFSELDRSQTLARRLAAENERLQVEKRALSTSARVEGLARSRLQMRAATPAVTAYVTYQAGATPTASVASAPGPAASDGHTP